MTAEALKGHLDGLLLAALEDQPQHGYAVIETLRDRGVTFIAAGRETEWRHWAESRLLNVGHRSFPTLRAAVMEYERENHPSADVARR